MNILPQTDAILSTDQKSALADLAAMMVFAGLGYEPAVNVLKASPRDMIVFDPANLTSFTVQVKYVSAKNPNKRTYGRGAQQKGTPKRDHIDYAKAGVDYLMFVDPFRMQYAIWPKEYYARYKSMNINKHPSFAIPPVEFIPGMNKVGEEVATLDLLS